MPCGTATSVISFHVIGELLKPQSIDARAIVRSKAQHFNGLTFSSPSAGEPATDGIVDRLLEAHLGPRDFPPQQGFGVWVERDRRSHASIIAPRIVLSKHHRHWSDEVRIGASEIRLDPRWRPRRIEAHGEEPCGRRWLPTPQIAIFRGARLQACETASGIRRAMSFRIDAHCKSFWVSEMETAFARLEACATSRGRLRYPFLLALRSILQTASGPDGSPGRCPGSTGFCRAGEPTGIPKFCCTRPRPGAREAILPGGLRGPGLPEV